MEHSANIFLIGPMGAGKSSVGRLLAERTGRQFLDSDAEIEARTGATIDLIFEIEGEPGFRQRESRVIEELSTRAGVVLATGGGAVLEAANRDCLKQRGLVIYLKATSDQLSKRTAKDRHRPLLQTEDRLGTITRLLAAREPYYNEIADLIIDTENRSVTRVVNEICRKLKKDAKSNRRAG